MTWATNYYCRMPLPILRKPYKTPEYRKNDSNQCAAKALWGTSCTVLSGSETRERVYLETI